MYATVADLRAEGVTEAMANDSRLTALIEEGEKTIERVTGWFFEPRQLTLHLDGRGGPTIESPVPLIQLARLAVGGVPIPLDELITGESPIGSGFDVPRITRKRGFFPKGVGNVEAVGLWGFTEHDGSVTGGTPREIRKACMLLVLRLLQPLAHEASMDARNRWRILEERTRDQSYRLDSVKSEAPFTGDPEIDAILLRYCRPAGMGAA